MQIDHANGVADIPRDVKMILARRGYRGGSIVTDFVLFVCVATFVTGIVLAAASLLAN